jgi:hypothetical protein
MGGGEKKLVKNVDFFMPCKNAIISITGIRSASSSSLTHYPVKDG